jgi:hypothetical protein
MTHMAHGRLLRDPDYGRFDSQSLGWFGNYMPVHIKLKEDTGRYELEGSSNTLHDEMKTSTVVQFGLTIAAARQLTCRSFHLIIKSVNVSCE